MGPRIGSILRQRWIRRVAIATGILGLVCGMAMVAALAVIRNQLPAIDVPPVRIRMEDIPDHVVQAFLATEDARFFDHGGIDALAVGRALAHNAWHDDPQGGSTITQQAAKLLLWSGNPPERQLSRKIKETLLAQGLESRYGKREILAIYLNRAYFGSGCWGLDAAADRYFGKTVSDLTVAEGALLAGIPARPRDNNPFTNSGGAERRRQYVLQRMVALDWLTEAEKAAALAEPLPRVR